MLSMTFKSSTKIAKDIERSLKVLLPETVAAMVWASVDKVHVMSAAVISRWRFHLDMAFMPYTSRRNRELAEAEADRKRMVRTVATDSSPQGLEHVQITGIWTIPDAVATAEVFF